MQTKDVILNLRTRMGLSQEELAQRVFVTRQAVSRWETGETIPNTETLKLLSQCFSVSINTLLGSPRQLFCQCCGMPLQDEILSRNADGTLNESYCKWCLADGKFTYSDMDDLIEVCVPHMTGNGFSEEQARAYMKERLPQLEYWKHTRGQEQGQNLEALKEQLLAEFNALEIPGMPRVEKLYALAGSDVNLRYPLPGGQTASFLNDNVTYLGNQLVSGQDEGRFFGILGCDAFLLVASYGENGKDPELLLYRKR